MLNRVYWYSHNIIVVEYEGTIIDEDVKEARVSYEEMIATSSEPIIHLVSDVTNRDDIAIKITNINTFKQYLPNNDRIGWLVVVDPNPHNIMKFIGNVVTKSVGRSLRIERTLDDAVTFLEEQTN